MDLELMTKRQLDMSQHRELLIENLGIFELRALGREVGVPSPTTKKRSELIDMIMDKIYNADSKAVKRTNKGRPYKKLSNLNNIMSHVTGSEEVDAFPMQKRPLKYEDIICFAQEVPVFSEVEAEVKKFKGVVRTSSAISYFLDSDSGEKVFIDNKDLPKFNLCYGDLVEVEAKKINGQNQFMVEKVLKINLVDFDKYYPAEIAEYKPIISSEKLVYGQNQLYCGRRNLICYKNNLFEDERFVNFAKFCKKDGYQLITLGLETPFEDQILFSQIPEMINMTTEYSAGCENGFNKVIDTIALTQRLLNKGRKCVLFISDIISLIKNLDKCYQDGDIQNGHSAKAIVIVQRLISIGKALENGASVTVVMTYRENDQNDAFLTNELERICSKFN